MDIYFFYDGFCRFFFFFFFSSRRRHTRCSRDWSSDVCSSDLRIDEATAKYYIFSGMLLPGLRRGVQKDLESIALVRAAQTALAIERFRLGHEDRSEERRVGKECRWRWWRHD